MPYSFTPHLNEQAWLYHRGNWSRIKNPLYRRGLSEDSSDPEPETLSKIFQGYNRKWWSLGPAFLRSNYSGTLVYAYAYSGKRKLPEYLIWIDTIGPSEIFFAQDLPDLLEIYSLLAPIVLMGSVVDLYKRGWEVSKQNRRKS